MKAAALLALIIGLSSLSAGAAAEGPIALTLHEVSSAVSAVRAWHRELPFRLDQGDPRQGPWLAGLERSSSKDLSGIRGHRFYVPVGSSVRLEAAMGDYRITEGAGGHQDFDAWSVSVSYSF